MYWHITYWHKSVRPSTSGTSTHQHIPAHHVLVRDSAYWYVTYQDAHPCTSTRCPGTPRPGTACTGTYQCILVRHVPVCSPMYRYMMYRYATSWYITHLPTYMCAGWLGRLGGTGRTSWYVTSWYITYQDVITYQDGMCQDVLPVPARHVPGRKKSSRQLL